MLNDIIVFSFCLSFRSHCMHASFFLSLSDFIRGVERLYHYQVLNTTYLYLNYRVQHVQ